MKQMAHLHADHSIAELAPVHLVARMEEIGRRLYACDITFAIMGGVSQGFYVLSRLLERRGGPDWKSLLNAALQGLGTVMSAKQILWLAELAEQASREPIARDFLLAEPWDPKPVRARLAGTRFLGAFAEYMSEYGHRALGESDPMSPRYAEIPDYVLSVIRGHMLASKAQPGKAIRREQESSRHDAWQRIRAAFGWRLHERMLFGWWYRRLCLFLALREGNRHNMMHISSAVRRLALSIGEQLAAVGVLQSTEDIFYLTADEIRTIVTDHARGWQVLITERRVKRAQNAMESAPDTLKGLGDSVPARETGGIEVSWRGIP
jgi:pyruvate,water dikinase